MNDIELRDSTRQLYDNMLEFFGKLPSPDTYPKQFEWYTKMYKYHMMRKGIEVDISPK